MLMMKNCLPMQAALLHTMISSAFNVHCARMNCLTKVQTSWRCTLYLLRWFILPTLVFNGIISSPHHRQMRMHCILLIDLYLSFNHTVVLCAFFYACTVPSFQRTPRRVTQSSEIVKESLVGGNNIGYQVPSIDDCATEKIALFSLQKPSEDGALYAFLIHSITNLLSKFPRGQSSHTNKLHCACHFLYCLYCDILSRGS